MSNYSFGNYICELREKKGLSQSQLGEKLGVTNKAVSRWENGGAYPSSELMLPLAKELGVSIEELYSAMSDSKTEKTKIRHLIDSLVKKSALIILPLAALNLVTYVLFIIFYDYPDKTTLIILAPIMAVIMYGFITLLFYIFKRNPMIPAKFLDLLSIFFIFVPLLNTLTTTINFLSDFPYGFSPACFGMTTIICAVLVANKKRI